MDTKNIKNIVATIAKDISTIKDEKTNSILRILLNLVESLVEENEELRKQLQKFKDEINCLKGEQGKPNFSGKKSTRNISSDKERKQKKTKKGKKKKTKKIKADRTVVCEVKKSNLPSDAVFKGYTESIVQDIIIKTDNVNFKKEVYYSPSLKKTFIGTVPTGYEGEFGPGIKSLILNLTHDSLISQPALKRLFETVGVFISSGTISRMLIDNIDIFHNEKQAIVKAGMQSTPHQHIDDTGCKVNGKNYYTHILCNPLYTAYFTMPKKSRLTVLSVLNQGNFCFQLNNEAYELMKRLNLPEKRIAEIKHLQTKNNYNKKELNNLIKKIFPNPKKYKRYKNIIIEATAIAGFHGKEKELKTLICDDAPQFKHLLDIALCWVHEGRHYKKLNPIIPIHKEYLDNFLTAFWEFYKKLLNYKSNPSSEIKAKNLSTVFDKLFSTKTGYEKLDNCIAKTTKKKSSLLMVLKHPELPLHNNPAELGARAEKRKADVSLQTKNAKGTKAKDTFMTIIQTSRKLGVNIYDYIFDRITGKFGMTSLANLIVQCKKNSSIIFDSS